MSKEKTVFVAGNFNVLHPGHLRLLRFASECGEKLIVGVYSDRISGKASHVPEELRFENILDQPHNINKLLYFNPDQLKILTSNLRLVIFVNDFFFSNDFRSDPHSFFDTFLLLFI